MGPSVPKKEDLPPAFIRGFFIGWELETARALASPHCWLPTADDRYRLRRWNHMNGRQGDGDVYRLKCESNAPPRARSLC